MTFELHHLQDAISRIADELRLAREQKLIEFEWHKSHAGFATKHDLHEMENRIMSKIETSAGVITAHLNRIEAGIDNIAGDLLTLKNLIEQLQTNPGPITPADQAILDTLEALAARLTDKVEALAALNPETPPVEDTVLVADRAADRAYGLSTPDAQLISERAADTAAGLTSTAEALAAARPGAVPPVAPTAARRR